MNLDPIATIIDAHLHVWDPSRGVYPWLGEHLAPVNRAMTLREVMPELTDRGVGAVVLVQSADAGFDTDLMFETARSHPEVAGVVGWVPLDLPAEAAGRLARLRDEPLFAGVRNLIHERADPDWILRPDVDAGLGLLEQAEVPFDFVAGGPQALATAAEVARRHPGLHLILDHLGAPPLDADSGQAQQWLHDLEVLAGHPRVYAKLSGLYLGPDPAGDRLRRAGSHIRAALRLFGSDRLMYGGDWPICLLHEPYGRTLDIVRHSLPDLDATGWHDILTATATRVYGIDLRRPASARP
ncbi:amidohydrolase family protein [Catellatospora bangladeshensis]|uniref:Metal-dependent hydrolase n=1 Tax=Catellatospora bangladeshensis TaxID=310355 RepID=A0A8J3NPH7_9ACTN|nr:amidohydrolase family protein [Catellatospora bangladeshensis]GIF85955.1 metal-dependent hydrolase [Catellatospora bangladeshensis]